ncbi:Os01g0656400 [Oryza sativa Japonica Group]|nr:transcription factor WRKY98 [Oryza sativa Indica Group]BAF05669.1 Os01g0656400 [Oryza sativa Japonica Group]BAS73504.1 Os01g0656400 [Oryza sativa Japonica Group]|eukprot:NP_001043755.1 Os01g0656400 [Oryza sativa Japonica Group]
MAAGADERCRALVSGLLSSIDRSISIARSCCTEAAAAGRLTQQAGAAPESPPSADGSAGSDLGADSRCRANAAGPCKKRKTLPKWSKQVKVRSVQDVGPLDDGFSWRKYGQKDILGAKYPRAYFRCTHRHTQGCHASKQVQRADGDPLLFDVVYHGDHTCAHGVRSAAAAIDGQAAASAEQKHQPTPPQEQNAVSVAFTSMAVVNASTSSPFVSPAMSDCQISYELGGGSMAGVRNVPDVELASKTNSSMGDDMEFMFSLDSDFLDTYKYSSYF